MQELAIAEMIPRLQAYPGKEGIEDLTAAIKPISTDEAPLCGLAPGTLLPHHGIGSWTGSKAATPAVQATLQFPYAALPNAITSTGTNDCAEAAKRMVHASGTSIVPLPMLCAANADEERIVRFSPSAND